MNISNKILSSGYGLPHPLTAQSIFDKASLHLVHQGKRSLLDDGLTCAYRGDNGLSCAVGALISEERYTEEMEGNNAESLVTDLMPELEPYIDLLLDFQVLHDRSGMTKSISDIDFDMKKLMRGLRIIAERHVLSSAILDAPSEIEIVASTAPAEITSLLRPSPVKTEA